jgi:hypothetical protein
VALTWPATARGDGDPASDVLLRQDAYYPYAPPTSPPLRTALAGQLARLRADGYPMKVALIQSPADLGAYAPMYVQPQQYANLLANELATIRHGSARTEPLHLLVVFTSVITGSGLGDHVDDALGPVKVDAAAQADGLTQAAMRAVARVATAEGHRTTVPPAAQVKLTARNASAKRPGGPSILGFLAPAALAVGAAVLASLRARRNRPAG